MRWSPWRKKLRSHKEAQANPTHCILSSEVEWWCHCTHWMSMNQTQSHSLAPADCGRCLKAQENCSFQLQVFGRYSRLEKWLFRWPLPWTFPDPWTGEELDEAGVVCWRVDVGLILISTELFVFYIICDIDVADTDLDIDLSLSLSEFLRESERGQKNDPFNPGLTNSDDLIDAAGPFPVTSPTGWFGVGKADQGPGASGLEKQVDFANET